MENRLDGWMDKIDGKDKSSTGWTCGQADGVQGLAVLVIMI